MFITHWADVQGGVFDGAILIYKLKLEILHNSFMSEDIYQLKSAISVHVYLFWYVLNRLNEFLWGFTTKHGGNGRVCVYELPIGG